MRHLVAGLALSILMLAAGTPVQAQAPSQTFSQVARHIAPMHHAPPRSAIRVQPVVPGHGGPPPGAFHPLTKSEVEAIAKAGCTEAGNDPNPMNELYVQYSVYDRALRDRRDFGGWNLVRVTHHPGQYNGVEWNRPCGGAQWRRSMSIAFDIVHGLFTPAPGWEHVSNFLAPCYSSEGGKRGFRNLVYLGTHGGHDFYRERRPGERPHFLDCRESPTYGWRPHWPRRKPLTQRFARW